MTPKEKANELANKFISKSVFDMTDGELKEQRKQGKAFALIAVDEILEVIYYEGRSEYIYWQEVKQEIEKL